MDKKDLNFLREIGIEKIKQDTKLDAARISDILEKRFEKIDYVRAKGFVKILEREYGLDLSDWLEEYHLSISSKDDETSQEPLKVDEVMADTAEKPRKKKILLSLAVILFCVIALFILMSRDSKEVQTESLKQSALTSAENPQSSTQSVETQESQNQETSQTIGEKNDELPSTSDALKNDSKPLSEFGVPLFEKVKIQKTSALKLAFDRPVWVGIIELDDKKKNAKTQAKYKISLNQEKLIYIAHGKFVATIGDATEKFKDYEPIFLIYTKDGGLRRLTKTEYLFINGGVEW